jgi:hypothetical protein
VDRCYLDRAVIVFPKEHGAASIGLLLPRFNESLSMLTANSWCGLNSMLILLSEILVSSPLLVLTGNT